MSLKTSVKLTGYADIDNLLIKTHSLLKEGELLKKEIDASLKYIPTSPYASSSRKARLKNRSSNIQRISHKIKKVCLFHTKESLRKLILIL